MYCHIFIPVQKMCGVWAVILKLLENAFSLLNAVSRENMCYKGCELCYDDAGSFFPLTVNVAINTLRMVTRKTPITT